MAYTFTSKLELDVGEADGKQERCPLVTEFWVLIWDLAQICKKFIALPLPASVYSSEH